VTKNCKCELKLVVLLLLEYRNVVEKFVLSRIVRVHVGKDIKNCVRLRYRRMLVDASAHL